MSNPPSKTGCKPGCRELETPCGRKEGIQSLTLHILEVLGEGRHKLEHDYYAHLTDWETSLRVWEAQRVTCTSSIPNFAQINRPPVKLTLLTCQVRPNPEEKKCFDLVTRE